ncbi:polyprenyl synthetase family protein [Halioxenophilus sp. WMMB6]|uniref:polyprenyl synthetase family protein n=1 Tax=Halioxenophilus sp. WMMB6 TaxID=3073815 RepID=UPI00295EF76A|nr:polyprenyl synthetase family protein [Halioxenophilus sp. WMMB6]
MLPFLSIVREDFAATNQLILDQLHSDVGLVENIGHHLIDAGGKRLRPLLVLLSARLLEYPGQRHLDLAAIIEFIHTATLLHDDVVDMSELRRGRPTANANWGNAPSVLVGDFLYSRAFQMMVAIGDMGIMSILSNTTNVISEGEVQQLVNIKDPSVSEANYFEVIYKKTAALFEAACTTAAVLAQVPEAQKEAIGLYGKHLGLAFQLVDDTLDYEGDTATLGKNVGDDLAEGKPTLPLIYAMANGSAEQRELIAGAIRSGSTDHLSEIVEVVKATGGLAYTHECANQSAKSALAQLDNLPQNGYTQALADLANFAVDRDR